MGKHSHQLNRAHGFYRDDTRRTKFVADEPRFRFPRPTLLSRALSSCKPRNGLCTGSGVFRRPACTSFAPETDERIEMKGHVLGIVAALTFFSMSAVGQERVIPRLSHATSTGGLRRLPLVDADGKDSGCVYEYDGVCYASLDSLQRVLLEQVKTKRPDLPTETTRTQIQSLRDGLRVCADALLYDDTCFASQEALVAHLIARLDPEEREMRLHKNVRALHDRMIYTDSSKLRLPFSSPLDTDLQYALVELDWEILDNQIEAATSRGNALERERAHQQSLMAQAPAPRVTSLFLHGGRVRDDREHETSTHSTHSVRIMGRMTGRPRFLLLRFTDQGPARLEWNVDVAVVNARGEMTDHTSHTGLLALGVTPLERYGSTTVQDLQNALGRGATLIGVGGTPQPLLDRLAGRSTGPPAAAR